MVAYNRVQGKGEIIVAGIDQALINLGFAVSVRGQIVTLVFKEPKLRGGQRLLSHKRNLQLYLQMYGPSLIAMEGYSHGSVHRSFDLGEIGGVTKCLAAELEIPLIVVPPKTLKKFVTGSGAADKEKMIECVNKHYGIRTSDDNAADAAGLAKFAEIYTSEHSHRRCELETAMEFKHSEFEVKTKKIFHSKKGV